MRAGQSKKAEAVASLIRTDREFSSSCPRKCEDDITAGMDRRIAVSGHPPYYRTDCWLLEDIMAWTTPTLVEICIGLEINGYLPAEF